jgi:hypothetical protein
VYKDPSKKLASLIITNKRAKVGAKVAVDVGVALPAQKATRYEYSGTAPKAIGELPPLDVSGKTINITIGPMSIQRIDLTL